MSKKQQENLSKNGAANSFTEKDKNETKRADKTAKQITEEIKNLVNGLNELKIPGKKIIHINKLKFSSIYSRLKKKTDYFEDYDEYTKHEGRGFEPDGGVLLLIDENENETNFTEWEPVFCCEMKRQGKKENKDKNNCGNAIERGSKNIQGFEDACRGGEIFPYILFGWGYDFQKEYMHGKMSPMNHGGGYNKELLMNGRDGVMRATIYTKEEKWTEYEMLEKSLCMVKNVMRYYKNKKTASNTPIK